METEELFEKLAVVLTEAKIAAMLAAENREVLETEQYVLRKRVEELEHVLHQHKLHPDYEYLMVTPPISERANWDWFIIVPQDERIWLRKKLVSVSPPTDAGST